MTHTTIKLSLKKEGISILSIELSNYLKEGNKNTREIHAHLHETWPRWCPNMRRLSNLLAKSREFVETGKEKAQSNLSGTYNLSIWGLANEAGLDN